MKRLIVFLGVAFVSQACADTGERCETFFVIPIRTTDATLRFRAPAPANAVPCYQGVCPGVCCYEEPECEPGFLVCGPPMGGLGPVASGSFRVVNNIANIDQTTKRTVLIESSDPNLSLLFDLPDPRIIDGEVSWSFPAGAWFSYTPMNSCAGHVPPVTASGRMRVLSRVGGIDGENGVTPDYHAVVEVMGRAEAVFGDGDSDCLRFPETEFYFVFEENYVMEERICEL